MENEKCFLCGRKKHSWYDFYKYEKTLYCEDCILDVIEDISNVEVNSFEITSYSINGSFLGSTYRPEELMENICEYFEIEKVKG